MKVILVAIRGATFYKRKMEGELKEHTQKNECIIPTKRKREANHGGIVKKQRDIKIQKSIDNTRNSKGCEIRVSYRLWLHFLSKYLFLVT